MKYSFIGIAALTVAFTALAQEPLRIFTWEGYCPPEDITAVNQLLKEKGYDFKAEVITPFAEGPEQMFTVLRDGKADISFLTLNYIMMQDGKTAKLLQPINTSSPRLFNYKSLNQALTSIPMGVKNGQPLYIPFGGGSYGIWADLNKYKPEELPKTITELATDPKWKGKLSLTKGQVQPNVALASLMAGQAAWKINDLAVAGKRDEVVKLGAELLPGLKALYGQVNTFWDAAPQFSSDVLTASYGIEIAGENAKGGKWMLLKFKEGQTVWMDTINFHSLLSGKKLEAAEIFANYFIGKQVQDRVVKNLSMVAVSTLVSENPLIAQDPDFFKPKMFWPAYSPIADNVMKKMSDDAMAAAGKK
jgi:hypothetical protein